MTKFEQIFLQNLGIRKSGKNVQISLQEYLKMITFVNYQNYDCKRWTN